MKRKETINFTYKNPVHLYRDELIEISKILTQGLKSKGFSLSFEGYESEDVDSIPTNQKVANNLSLNVFDPYMSVDINRYSSTIYCSEDTLLTRGAFGKIKEILEKSGDPLWYVRTWLGYTMYAISTIAFTVLALNMFYSFYPLSGFTVFLLASLCLLSVVSWIQLTWPAKPVIEFDFRDNSKSFWDRNNDQIFVGLLVGVPTTILGILIGKLL